MPGGWCLTFVGRPQRGFMHIGSQPSRKENAEMQSIVRWSDAPFYEGIVVGDASYALILVSTILISSHYWTPPNSDLLAKSHRYPPAFILPSPVGELKSADSEATRCRDASTFHVCRLKRGSILSTGRRRCELASMVRPRYLPWKTSWSDLVGGYARAVP